jgi:hypothetical protein
MQLMEIVFTSRIVKGVKRAYAELKDCKQTQKALKEEEQASSEQVYQFRVLQCLLA